MIYIFLQIIITFVSIATKYGNRYNFNKLTKTFNKQNKKYCTSKNFNASKHLYFALFLYTERLAFLIRKLFGKSCLFVLTVKVYSVAVLSWYPVIFFAWIDVKTRKSQSNVKWLNFQLFSASHFISFWS